MSKKKPKQYELFELDGSGEFEEAMVWLKAAIIVAVIGCISAVVWQ